MVMGTVYIMQFAHQAGYIGRFSHGYTFVGQHFKTLALVCMQKYPEVRIEEGNTRSCIF